jgi:hypothetical protein
MAKRKQEDATLKVHWMCESCGEPNETEHKLPNGHLHMNSYFLAGCKTNLCFGTKTIYIKVRMGEEEK